MFTPKRKSVSEILASFESKKDNPTAHPQHHHPEAGLLANMNPQKQALHQAQKTVPPPVDTALDAVGQVATSAKKRPAHFRLPSWIGPKPLERDPTPHLATMKVPVTIDFSSPNINPPVFVGTSLSHPEWEPVEMESTWNDKKGRYHFFKSFEAEEGEYQYKLRLGPGDWWICDDTKPIVQDGAGNENNLVVVEPVARPVKVASSDKAPPHQRPVSPAIEVSEINETAHKRRDSLHATSPASHEAPVPETPSIHFKHNPSESSPLFRHETLAHLSKHGDHTEDNREAEMTHALRQEHTVPISDGQSHVPLFRHESIAIDDVRDDSRTVRRFTPLLAGHSSVGHTIPEEADDNDPSLEKFPTDHHGIMRHLDRTCRSMQEDETLYQYHSRSHSPSGSVIVSHSPSMPSVREDVTEELEEAQQSAAAAKARQEPLQDEEVNFNRETDVKTSQQAVSALMERPAAPITPPMTPEASREEEEFIDSPLNIRERILKGKEKAKYHVKRVTGPGLPFFAVGLAVIIAAASAAIAWWHIRIKSDDVAI